MNQINIGRIECPIFIGQLPEHNEIKSDILSNIERMKEAERLVLESENTDINKCDWTVPHEVDREYLHFFMSPLEKYITNLMPLVGFDQCKIHNIWFQQYIKNSIHNWHIHLECQWTNVYYLELPENAPKTEILIPWKNNELITLDVKEGDMLTFPSLLIHRAPFVKNDTRKTIISYNCDFNLSSEILKSKYNF